MKFKFKYVILTTALAAALVGCGQETTETTDTTNTETEAVEETTTSVETEVPAEGQPVEGELTSDDVKMIAFEKAGVAEADVTDLSIELDEENGVRYYDVSFDVGQSEYDYDIDATTGEIIGEETENN